MYNCKDQYLYNQIWMLKEYILEISWDKSEDKIKHERMKVEVHYGMST